MKLSTVFTASLGASLLPQIAAAPTHSAPVLPSVLPPSDSFAPALSPELLKRQGLNGAALANSSGGNSAVYAYVGLSAGAVVAGLVGYGVYSAVETCKARRRDAGRAELDAARERLMNPRSFVDQFELSEPRR
jgi:hypothetical protein